MKLQRQKIVDCWLLTVGCWLLAVGHLNFILGFSIQMHADFNLKLFSVASVWFKCPNSQQSTVNSQQSTANSHEEYTHI
ncbi:MAG: hypothetical protein WBA89_28365 [Microcoleus sp.]|uniref:hypothetical protein n=1 Tax=Microcoleus sp. TaxID=44472 RepID=UPI003C78E698